MSLPLSIRQRLEGYEAERIDAGQSGASVLRWTRAGAPTLFLKSADGQGARALDDEVQRLRWLATRAPVPRVHAFVADGEGAFLLLAALPGRDGEQAAHTRPHAVVTGLAHALRRLHAQPLDGCPFDQGLAAQLVRARERLEAGLVDQNDFDEERRGCAPTGLLAQLHATRPAETLVLTHGDACLNNTLFDGGQFNGFIDTGRAGAADAYQDLALATRDIAGTLGDAWVRTFLDAYGLAAPDFGKLAYYRLLDEFF